jgi:glucose-6-phosphate 1-dehydrogenase
LSEPLFANPLAEGVDTIRRAPPGVLVVMGASGDLTARKLIPAIERLSRRRLLPQAFAVVGVARTPMDDEGFRDIMTSSVPDAGSGWPDVVKHSRYIAGEYGDPDTFARLRSSLEDL